MFGGLSSNSVNGASDCLVFVVICARLLAGRLIFKLRFVLFLLVLQI